LFGFGRIGLGRITLSCYFRGIPDLLRRGGNRVVITRVPPIAGVKRRAKRLGEQIEQAFGKEPVHLIGHSMGGLDARHLLADPAWKGRILSLTTIGTPHLGSALADAARARVGPLYRLLRTMRIDHRGFFDLTRRAARAVNRNTCVPASIPCFSVAGNPDVADVCWPLRPFYQALRDLEGENDGLVSVESSLGFGRPLPEWPIDHLRQMSWMPPSRGPSSVSSVQSHYVGILENLVKHGFGASATETETEPKEVVRKPLKLFGLNSILW
jgi:triacylglycerol lipase